MWTARLVGLAVLVLGAAGPACAEDSVKVTVVAILASDKHQTIDKKLTEVAQEVRKKEPDLTGFTIERTTTKEIKIGQEEKFPLLEEQVVVVIVLKEDKEGRRSLSIKPPTLGEITYTCACGKFFPVITRYTTANKDRLIIAVMCKPCVK